LERILALRKREARQARVQRFEARRVTPLAPSDSLEVTDEPVLIESSETVKPASPKRRETVEKQTRPATVPPDTDTTDIEPQFEDEFGYVSSPVSSGRAWRKVWLNRALTVVEVAAVGGLAYLLITLFSSLQAVAQTTADIQAQYQSTLQAGIVPPTATPAINIASVVLPGGHVYDSNSNTARFNLDEVPAAYRAAYQNQVLNFSPTAQPSPSPGEPLSIRIPALNVAASVVSGDSWDNLQRGVGHHTGSANPGELGNMVLSGHDDVYGSLFKDLDQLKPGNEIIVTTQLNTFTYVVQTHEIVGPTETRVMDNSRHDSAQITLITCYPYQVDTRRYVVYGVLKAS
jgi:sortase A